MQTIEIIYALITEYGTMKQTIASELNMSLPTFRRRLRDNDFNPIHKTALLNKWGGLFQ